MLIFVEQLAPWGGHSVFPNIYKDMRHPKKYNRAVDITYIFTVCITWDKTVQAYTN